MLEGGGGGEFLIQNGLRLIMVVIYYYLQRISDNVLKSHIDNSSYFEIVAKNFHFV